MNDFLSQLHQSDIFRYIMISVEATILGYGPVYLAKNRIINNYSLRRDFKMQNVKTVGLPIEVVRKVDDLNESEILKKQYGDILLEFINVLKRNISKENLSILFNNFSTLSFSEKNYKLSRKLFGGETDGMYNEKENQIVLDKKSYHKTIYHELLHASSTIAEPNGEKYYSGFHQINNNGSIGEGLNEGYTQYLTEKYFGDKEILRAYDYEKTIAKAIEFIVGKEKMESLYFNANLNGLVECLKHYCSEEEIYKFIDTMDFIRNYARADHLTSKSYELIATSMRNVNSFLVRTIFAKNIIEFETNEIDKVAILTKTSSDLANIPFQIKFNKKDYSLYDAELFSEAISTVLSNFNLSEDENTISK